MGVRTLNEAGTVGQWAREQVELFCISKLINCVLEPDEEWVFLDFHFAMRKLPWLTSADCLQLLLHCYCQPLPSWLLLVMLQSTLSPLVHSSPYAVMVSFALLCH